MYHYAYANNNVPTQYLKYRGTVYDGRDVVCGSLGYIPSYNTSTLDDDEVAFLAPEGFYIRVFYFKRQWYVCTHRKLSAWDSFWGSDKSHGEMFADALRSVPGLIFNESMLPIYNAKYEDVSIISALCRCLTPGTTYMFLVSNTESTRIVCPAPPTPTVWFVASMLHAQQQVDLSPLPMIQPLQKVTTITDLSGLPSEYQGYLVINTRSSSAYKIIPPEYEERARIRGNVPSIRLRYVQLLSEPDKLNKLEEMYPERTREFAEYDRALAEDIPCELHRIYMLRYEDCQYYHTDPVVHAVLKRLRDMLDYPTVKRIANALAFTIEPTTVNKLLRLFKKLGGRF